MTQGRLPRRQWLADAPDDVADIVRHQHGAGAVGDHPDRAGASDEGLRPDELAAAIGN